MSGYDGMIDPPCPGCSPTKKISPGEAAKAQAEKCPGPAHFTDEVWECKWFWDAIAQAAVQAHGLAARPTEAQRLARAAHAAIPALAAEVERLRAVLRSAFGLECCDDLTCTEAHATKTADTIKELREERAEAYQAGLEAGRAGSAELVQSCAAVALMATRFGGNDTSIDLYDLQQTINKMQKAAGIEDAEICALADAAAGEGYAR
jgi:hypothetical protein